MTRAAGPPVSRMADPTLACSSRAVVGASAICSGLAGIRPAVSTTGTGFPPTGV